MVAYVSLLMFLQQDARGLGNNGFQTTEMGIVTAYSALLLLPWILKSYARRCAWRVGHFRQILLLTEIFLFFSLISAAFAFSYGMNALMGSLFATSTFCAWHQLTSEMYYEQMLSAREQRLYFKPRIAFSQLAIIITYGFLIITAGALQVFYRQVLPAWRMVCYAMAGTILLIAIYNLFALRKGNDNTSDIHPENSPEVKTAARWSLKWWGIALTVFLILLPQSLLFHTRVLFLFDTHANGGLECSIQEIGFAQGTVGVIAFTIGLILGRYTLHIRKHLSLRTAVWFFCLIMGISPLVYFFMVHFPPASLFTLCICTFLTQISFGFGLNICKTAIQHISGDRYRNCSNFFFIPLVCGCMIIPMTVSGLLVQQMGYPNFFLVSTLLALLPIMMGKVITKVLV